MGMKSQLYQYMALAAMMGDEFPMGRAVHHKKEYEPVKHSTTKTGEKDWLVCGCHVRALSKKMAIKRAQKHYPELLDGRKITIEQM